MADRLKAVQLRLERAQEQIRDLETACRSFFNSCPYAVSVDTDKKTGETLHYLSKVEDVPACIPNLTGEIVHSIRSSLDHLAYQLFLTRRTNPEDEGGYVSFPIYDPAKTTEASAFGKIKILGDEAINGIRACNPYRGGNDVLWPLHKLDVISKHRCLLTVGAACIGLAPWKVFNTLFKNSLLKDIIPQGFPPGMRIALPDGGFRYPLKEGDILFRGAASYAELNKQLDFSFTIMLNEPDVIKPQHPVAILHDMANHVSDIVNCFASLL